MPNLPLPNLPPAEREALQWLKSRADLVVTSAEKGNTIVLRDVGSYMELAYQHLHDPNTYSLLSFDPTMSITCKFTNI